MSDESEIKGTIQTYFDCMYESSAEKTHAAFHPAAKIRVRGKSVRRPCFVADGTRMIFPSFGVYTGGLNLPAGNHCIVGNGAVINLQGLSVEAGAGVVLDISGVSFTNGNRGIDFTAGATGMVECCNFIDNYAGSSPYFLR